MKQRRSRPFIIHLPPSRGILREHQAGKQSLRFVGHSSLLWYRVLGALLFSFVSWCLVPVILKLGPCVEVSQAAGTLRETRAENESPGCTPSPWSSSVGWSHPPLVESTRGRRQGVRQQDLCRSCGSNQRERGARRTARSAALRAWSAALRAWSVCLD